MNDDYEPSSDFLKMVIADEISFAGSDFADSNLRRLIAMTGDVDRSNRDWATLLLSQQEMDTPEIRAALLVALQDEDEAVRAEALLGLAPRDRALALPFAAIALSGDSACMPVFEAAALIADASLVELLRVWAEPSYEDFLNQLARDALTACESGVPRQ